MKKKINVILISISNPILIGIYMGNILEEKISKEGKISDVLPVVFENLLKKYDIDTVVYTNSPGNFLGIKLTFIFLKTLLISKKITIKAIDGFYFNNNSPIKAIMGKYFVMKNNDRTKKEIIIKTINDKEYKCRYSLPKMINLQEFSKNIDPVYISPAVY